MQDRGLKGRYGTWLITGRPKVVLLEQASVYDRLDKIKYFLWQNHDIPSPAGDWLYGQRGVLRLHGEQFLTGYMQHPLRRRPVIAHFHEWMAGWYSGVRRAAAAVDRVHHARHAAGPIRCDERPVVLRPPAVRELAGRGAALQYSGQVKIERAASDGRTCSPRSARSPITNARTCWGARRTSCCPTASTSSGSWCCTSSRTCIASTSSTFTGS